MHSKVHEVKNHCAEGNGVQLRHPEWRREEVDPPGTVCAGVRCEDEFPPQPPPPLVSFQGLFIDPEERKLVVHQDYLWNLSQTECWSPTVTQTY